jgi:hypothetical protein
MYLLTVLPLPHKAYPVLHYMQFYIYIYTVYTVYMCRERECVCVQKSGTANTEREAPSSPLS